MKINNFLQISILTLLILIGFIQTRSTGLTPNDNTINPTLIDKSNPAIKEVLKCNRVWKHGDPCTFVKENCPELTEGLVDFIQLYYCNITPSVGPYIGILFFFLTVGLMFLLLGTVASDFFCPNLATIASELNLSESVAGVTFLAFGNGSPDVFSTFSAFKADGGALAMGELIGAAWFIISVVVGSMAIIKSFKVIRTLFIRDILFFTGAVIFMLVIVWDRRLTQYESICLIIYYLIYVATVIFMNWYDFKGMNTLPLLSPENRFMEFDDDDDELEGLLLSNFESPPQEDVDDDMDESNPLISQMTLSNMYLNPNSRRRPSLTPITYYKRMNFWTMDEIAKALTEGSNESTVSMPSLVRRRTEFLPTSAKLNNHITKQLSLEVPHQPFRSYSDNSIHTPILASLEEEEEEVKELQHMSQSIPLLGSVKFMRPNAPVGITIPQKGIKILTLSPFCEEDGLSITSSPHQDSRPDSQLDSVRPPLPFCTSPPCPEEIVENTLLDLLFPGFCEWSELNLLERLINLISAPFILILTLTVPTPTDKELNFDKDESNNPVIVVGTPMLPAPIVQVKFKENFTSELILGFLQTFTIPIFLFETILVSNDLADRKDIGYAVLVGTIAAVGLILYLIALNKSNRTIPDFRLLRAFLGFSQSICWISMSATEVVDILRALGIIFSINEEIIGLTVFAVGNSLGDFVANLSVAKMGYPMMAVSACFAGPMLNMMLGPGLAGTYLTLIRHEDIQLPVSHIMTIAGSGVLLTLLAYIIYLHVNHFRIGRKFSIALISFYFIGMAISVAVTFYGEQ